MRVLLKGDSWNETSFEVFFSFFFLTHFLSSLQHKFIPTQLMIPEEEKKEEEEEEKISTQVDHPHLGISSSRKQAPPSTWQLLDREAGDPIPVFLTRPIPVPLEPHRRLRH